VPRTTQIRRSLGKSGIIRSTILWATCDAGPCNAECTVGGTSFLYFFDYTTGQFVSTSAGGVVGQRIGNAIAVGINTYQLPSGKVVSTVTTSDDQHPVFGNPSNPLGVALGKRVGWRELLN